MPSFSMTSGLPVACTRCITALAATRTAFCRWEVVLTWEMQGTEKRSSRSP